MLREEEQKLGNAVMLSQRAEQGGSSMLVSTSALPVQTEPALGRSQLSQLAPTLQQKHRYTSSASLR